MQLFKQRVALLGVEGGHLALFFVAVDDHRGLAQDVGLFLHIGVELGGVFLQVAAQADVGRLLRGKTRVEVVGHIFALDLHAVFPPFYKAGACAPAGTARARQGCGVHSYSARSVRL